MQFSAADILIRMDADDLCRPDRFAKQMAYMEEHTESVALGSRVMLIDPEGCPISEFTADGLDHDKIDAAHMAGRGGTIVHPSAMIRKSAMLVVGGYRADYLHAEDIDLFLRLAEVGRLANLNGVLLDYRQHPGSIGYRHSQRQQESAQLAVIDAHKRRGLGSPAMGSQPSQPVNPPSLADIHRKWGWRALNAGYQRTARKHAWKAFSLAPFKIENLKLCACALLGY